MAAIERTSGESRLTTVIADAANRQAQNDSTRDVLRNIDRTGAEAVASTKDSFATILGTVERNAGENRIQTLTSSGILDNSLRDVRYSILSDVNRVGNELTSAGVQNFNVLSKSVNDSAWEQRTAAAIGFQNLSEQHLRTITELNKSADCHYSSLMLEQQKMGQFITSKADNHFAMNQLEMQKVKEGLACQASTYNAAAILDAHRNREAIQKDLAEAKYEALKSQQFLADKIGECCCTMKEKMDTLDRDRLRDHLTVARDKNSIDQIDRDRLRDNLNVSRDRNAIYEGIEFQQLLYGGRGGYDDRGDHGHHGHRGGRR
jgi:hypothetical protein